MGQEVIELFGGSSEEHCPWQSTCESHTTTCCKSSSGHERCNEWRELRGGIRCPIFYCSSKGLSVQETTSVHSRNGSLTSV